MDIDFHDTDKTFKTYPRSKDVSREQNIESPNIEAHSFFTYWVTDSAEGEIKLCKLDFR